MNMTIELPIYDNKDLAAFTDRQLIESMIRDEDRVPRNVIDECVRRGVQILDAWSALEVSDDDFEKHADGHWWMQLHVVMMLGLMPGEEAGIRLVEVIRKMSHTTDYNVDDWLAGYWPELTRNKPLSVIEQLREICEDKQVDWYMRSNLADAVVASAYQQGAQQLEQALDWIARLVKDEEDDWDYRLVIANTLLDFPRERYHDLLIELAAQQTGISTVFDKGDLNRAYSMPKDHPHWVNFSDPWSFYESREIEARQQRWQKEAMNRERNKNKEKMKLDTDDAPKSSIAYKAVQTYQRETPKVGRNDPCPCGSGKKFKKCCLN